MVRTGPASLLYPAVPPVPPVSSLRGRAPCYGAPMPEPPSQATVGYRHTFDPSIVLLRQAPEHLVRAPSRVFWEQLAFHVPQRDDNSCGLASLTQVFCVLRLRRALGPLTQDQMAVLLDKEEWEGGATLAELEGLARKAAERSGLDVGLARRHLAPGDASALEGFRIALHGLEAGEQLVIANFSLEPVLGVPAGHHSPIGAFDAASDRALVLDTYRQGWEPYWAPLALLGRAMADEDPESGEPRGYLVLRPGAPVTKG